MVVLAPLLITAAHSAPPDPDPVLSLLCDCAHAVQKVRRQLRHITLEVTRRCNLHCAHCYARAGEAGGRRELSFLELCALGLSVRQDFGTRVSMAITGGEPLARSHLLLLLRFYRLLGLQTALSTNGTLLSRERARKLVRLVSGLAVSLDGLEEAHDTLRGEGSFRLAAAGLRRAARLPFRSVLAKTAVHSGNLTDLPGLHAFLLRLGVREWHLFPLEPWGRAVRGRVPLLDRAGHEALGEFFDAMKEDERLELCLGEQNSFARARPAREAHRLARCGAGVSSLAILADGSVTSCVQADRARIEGNVRDERLRTIWRQGFGRQRAWSWRTCGHHRFG